MSKKTCKACLHCSVENKNEAYCSGMPWHYPFGGSDTTALDKEACKYFLERDKPTIFHQITASPEVLAPNFVYFAMEDEEGRDYWGSSLLDGQFWKTEKEAFAATVKKLKEVAADE